ncbi:uncharacterized protein LOC119320260 [Triticum dicoccoides]|uniref:uncharacterized protein LOC119320260 n=1 Tax=Triticum dicoccoides TaxID=85692 RepID=UPI001891BCAE|nr:uncharacterized protein LOC119320260 [Triticum dicoccoides]
MHDRRSLALTDQGPRSAGITGDDKARLRCFHWPLRRRGSLHASSPETRACRSCLPAQWWIHHGFLFMPGLTHARSSKRYSDVHLKLASPLDVEGTSSWCLQTRKDMCWRGYCTPAADLIARQGLEAQRGDKTIWKIYQESGVDSSIQMCAVFLGRN